MLTRLRAQRPRRQSDPAARPGVQQVRTAVYWQPRLPNAPCSTGLHRPVPLGSTALALPPASTSLASLRQQLSPPTLPLQVLQRLSILKDASAALQADWRDGAELFSTVPTVPITAVAVTPLRGEQNSITGR